MGTGASSHRKSTLWRRVDPRDEIHQARFRQDMARWYQVGTRLVPHSGSCPFLSLAIRAGAECARDPGQPQPGQVSLRHPPQRRGS